MNWREDLSISERISKPVIDVLDGYVFDAGLELTVSCDIGLVISKNL